MMERPGGKRVVLSFAALDGDPYQRDRTTGEFLLGEDGEPIEWGPTLRAIADRHSELFGQVSDWYYLCHPIRRGGARRRGRSAAEVAEEMRGAITRHIPEEERPSFHVLKLVTDRPPNDHADLFRHVSEQLRRVRASHPKAEVVLLLSAGTSAMHAVLVLAGATGIIEGPLRLVQVERGEGARARPQKPVVDVTLEVESILQVARRTEPARPGVDDSSGFGYDQARSPALKRTLEEIRRAAPVPFPILLRGERGVGKTSLARFIRAASPHRIPARDSEWPAVACGQFPDAHRLNLELCGSVKGAFTGAENRAGLLALAHGDTLFLDEIHDMEEDSQRVIIRVLEEKRYYPLGSNKPKDSRFRLITGTNQPDEVLEKRLAADFYDRIRDIEIWIPPLRECREDLDWMWAETWRRVAAESRVDVGIADGHAARILGALRGHPLPGNWRDLRRLAIRLAILTRAEGETSGKVVSEALANFERSAETKAHPPSKSATRSLSRRDANRLRDLEAVLGPDLAKLSQACRTLPAATALAVARSAKVNTQAFAFRLAAPGSIDEAVSLVIRVWLRSVGRPRPIRSGRAPLARHVFD